MINPTGTASSSVATTNTCQRIMLSRFWKYQASISGMAIFMTSEGCTTTPILSQRREPFLTIPNSATAISNVTPTV